MMNSRSVCTIILMFHDFFREELEREKAVLEQRIIQYQVRGQFIWYLLVIKDSSVMLYLF